ncbi:unnamed protein product [Trichogramma brassicae]|uniref:RCK N-terminal domain-containing protein n=1 Tax=Trichogramma brassicae TaxID=86971 RepID=A0A6H5I2Z6_9HYME|nr:unnamed protein product [Trichogramma brassicae]
MGESCECRAMTNLTRLSELALVIKVNARNRNRTTYTPHYTCFNARARAGAKVRVEYYVNENTFKERLQLYFIKNQRSSLRIRLANLFFKLLTCFLYIFRVITDTDPTFAACYGCTPGNKTEFLISQNLTEEEFQEHPTINWDAILWVHRPLELWIIQVILAMVSLTEALLLAYLGYKLLYPPMRNLFIPVFLNCWLAKHSLENMFNDLHRAMQKSQSALSQQLMILSATLLCLVFTSVCGIQHFQRAGHRHLNLFQSTYYVVVTFSTVGYGDFVPDIWPSQLYMVIMICVALIVLPTQFEQLAFTWMERQKLGGSYSSHRAQSEKHVVVCSTTLQADTIMDFLNEFYAHPLLQDYYVVLLSPMELDTTMRMILQVPIWAQRVIYIQGSCLKDGDLAARMNEAEACFVLAARNYADKTAADEHTILRSWAVKDFAPNVPQYVQIFRPENKLHVKFAEHVVCEDEFKYALLANNCTCPGASTLVTLLLHTSRGQRTRPSWWPTSAAPAAIPSRSSSRPKLDASSTTTPGGGQAAAGCGGGQTGTSSCTTPGTTTTVTTTTSCVGLQQPSNATYLDPGGLGGGGDSSRQQGLKDGSLSPQTSMTGNHLDVPRSLEPNPNLLSPEILTQRRGSRRPSILPVPDMLTSSTLHLPGQESLEDHEGNESEDEMDDDVPWRSPSEKIAIVKGFPPVSPFIGVSPTLCYLLKEKKPLCCLQLAQVCEHCSYRNAKEYNWQNKTIILAADYASNGIYNFIIPLRAHFRSKTSLNPIILLLERRPEIAFLDAISYFPLVYWMRGSIDCLDDLLRAGITLAENVVVVNKELNNSAEEDTLADCNTIVAVQTMFKFFPSIKSITELSQSSNMRFMQFRAHDKYALHLSKMEKREKERGSHISYMFRLPFAAGSVFSASMLDTLLYQAFVKDYVITFVRLLLGVDQAPGSGFLTSMKITKEDMWIRTYGRLYQKLCSTTCEIPIGIYRTQDTSIVDTSHYSVSMGDEARDNHTQQIERAEIANLVRSRMESLNLPVADYDDVSEKRNSLSYVIINPSCDLKLEEGDIVYLVRPSPFSAQKTFERHNSRRKSNISFCSAQLVAQMNAAVSTASGLVGGPGGGGGAPASRRGSGIGIAARAPPLSNTKSNSLSLPDSPTVSGSLRGRSNSLRVVDDILLRRSNSLRQGLSIPARRKSSLEDIGLGALSHPSNHNPIKIALNDSIGLEVTPPEEGSQSGSTTASNTGILDVGLPPMSVLSARLGSGLGGSMGGLYDPSPPCSSSSAYGGGGGGGGGGGPQSTSSSGQLQGAGGSSSSSSQQDPQHIQGTIV